MTYGKMQNVATAIVIIIAMLPHFSDAFLQLGQCKNDSCTRATCKNIGPAFHACYCHRGYAGANCEDVNECYKSPCHPYAVCNNTQGSYSCSCHVGFQGNGFICTEIDECATGTHDCDKNAFCSNTKGSYKCVCRLGFEGNGRNCSAIADVNECDKNPCHPNALCTNTRGSYLCSCAPGFQGNGIMCTDVNECYKSPCHHYAVCNNTQGSYSCSCYIGFQGNGSICTEIDECTTGKHDCHKNAICSNTRGSYRCVCRPGFVGNGRNCSAVDKCLQSPCQNKGICETTTGALGFKCRCLVGYSGPTCETKCKQESMDILLIEDVSSSISDADYQKIKDFEVELVSYSEIKPSIINVALMAFAGKAKLVFPLKSYSDDKTAAVQAVNVPQYEGGSTFLGDAIRMAVSDVFVESNGDRKNAENVVVLFTDGQSSQSSVISKNIGNLLTKATVYVVPTTAEADNSTISLVASPPYGDHVFSISNPLALDEIKQRTIYERCGKEVALKE